MGIFFFNFLIKIKLIFLKESAVQQFYENEQMGQNNNFEDFSGFTN